MARISISTSSLSASIMKEERWAAQLEAEYENKKKKAIGGA